MKQSSRHRQGRRTRIRGRICLVGLLLLPLAWLGAGCTAGSYRRSADREAGGILRAKASGVANVDGDRDLNVDAPAPISLDKLKRNAQEAEFLGKAANSEIGGRVVPLEDALRLAITYNRSYLAQKELIYLQTLELTLARHELAPIFSGTGSITRAGDRGGGGGATAEADGADGRGASRSNAGLAREVESGIDEIVSENTFASRSNLGFFDVATKRRSTGCGFHLRFSALSRRRAVGQ